MLQFPAIIDKISTLKDRSLKITLETSELNAEEMLREEPEPPLWLQLLFVGGIMTDTILLANILYLITH